jgi:Methyltransferase domain
MSKAIAITLYRRPDYTAKLFANLAQCYDIENYAVYISCDYDEAHKDDCLAVRRMAFQFGQEGFAKSSHIMTNNPRLGIDLNKLAVLPEAFESSDFVILLEDDTPPAQDALRYFEAMNQMFKDDPSVMSISGYNRYTEEEEHRRVLAEERYHLDRGEQFTPWGFGIWKDRYETVVGMDGEKYKAATGDNANGLFDHNFCRWMNEHPGHYTIYPVMPRTNHTGADRAEHTPSEEYLRENEFAPYGAWSQHMPDYVGEWMPKWPVDHDAYPRHPFDHYEDVEGAEYVQMMPWIMKWEAKQADLIGRWLCENLELDSVIDLGCGPGLYLLPFKSVGMEVYGLDACTEAGKCLEPGEYERFDLRFPYKPKRRYSLAICTEVLEHLHPRGAGVLIDTLDKCADTLLITWAVPGQGGSYHKNEVSHEQCLDIFESRLGYTLHPLQNEMRAFLDKYRAEESRGEVCGWLLNNAFLLQRSS